MKIENIDLFYCAIPDIKNIGDGSQDALVVRVQSGDFTGWGECEASPLVSIANFVCPQSHSACCNVRDVVLGQEIDSAEDIGRLHALVKERGLDIAQTDHTLSGIEIALWDLLGKAKQEPVYKLLGYAQSNPRLPYASQLFGDTPEETLEKAKRTRAKNYRAVKFGWGPFGQGSVQADRDHVAAAREGLGPEGILLIDVGTAWVNDVSRAALDVSIMEEFDVVWLEEPFVGAALSAYRALSQKFSKVKLAGGEGAQNFYQAQHLIDHGGVGFIQIDTGRIGGIGPAKKVADYALEKNVTFVNHTFTTHLALSASLQPFAGHPEGLICEYPVEASPLATNLTLNQIQRDDNGMVNLPQTPGLGMEVNLACIQKYLQDVQIVVNGKTLYQTPSL